MKKPKILSLLLVPMLATFFVGQINAEDTTDSEASVIITEPIVITETDWIFFSDLPHRSMFDARAHILQFENDLAADDTRMTAAILRADASHISGDVKKALLDSAKEIDKLADNIEYDATTTANVNKIFGKASIALAKYHTALAKKANEKILNLSEPAEHLNKPANTTIIYEQVGRQLNAAAFDLAHAAAWTGHELTNENVMNIKHVYEGANKLLAGRGWADTNKALEWLYDESYRLGHDIKEMQS